MLICLNGDFIPHEDAGLPVSDGAFLFGDSLFETLKADANKILLQDEHLDRLELSAKLLDFPCDRQRIETSLKQLSSALKAAHSRIRLTLSRGQYQGLCLPAAEQGWFLLCASDFHIPTDEQRQQGIRCITAPNQRVNPLSHLPQMKRGNYADCLYAADYARRNGAREALFVDPRGNLLEGATSNIFMLQGGKLWTPPSENRILAGVMRRQIINAATEIGISTVEEHFTKDDLYNAEEAFICNSLIDLLPINSYDNHSVPRGTTWKTLHETLRMRIET